MMTMVPLLTNKSKKKTAKKQQQQQQKLGTLIVTPTEVHLPTGFTVSRAVVAVMDQCRDMLFSHLLRQQPLKLFDAALEVSNMLAEVRLDEGYSCEKRQVMESLVYCVGAFRRFCSRKRVRRFGLGASITHLEQVYNGLVLARQCGMIKDDNPQFQLFVRMFCKCVVDYPLLVDDPFRCGWADIKSVLREPGMPSQPVVPEAFDDFRSEEERMYCAFNYQAYLEVNDFLAEQQCMVRPC
jgi:hypothetical protein